MNGVILALLKKKSQIWYEEELWFFLITHYSQPLIDPQSVEDAWSAVSQAGWLDENGPYTEHARALD